eukprot:6209468-Pleurochrysis_carterae.AAC.3
MHAFPRLVTRASAYLCGNTHPMLAEKDKVDRSVQPVEEVERAPDCKRPVGNLHCEENTGSAKKEPLVCRSVSASRRWRRKQPQAPVRRAGRGQHGTAGRKREPLNSRPAELSAELVE